MSDGTETKSAPANREHGEHGEHGEHAETAKAGGSAALEEIEERLGQIEELLAEDPEAAMRALDELDVDPDDGFVRYLRAAATWLLAGAAVAEPMLKELIIEDPSFSEVHYALAGVYEDLQEPELNVRHLLAVLALDAAEDPSEETTEAEESQVIVAAEAALASLPEEIRQRLGNVAIVVETRPSWAIVEEGFDPRALGMFEGPDDLDQRVLQLTPMNPRIVLFTANLASSWGEPVELAEEVKVTVLHEIGHYFGLDEDDVDSLGLM